MDSSWRGLLTHLFSLFFFYIIKFNEHTSYTLYRITSFVAITSFRSFSKLLWNNASSPALVWANLESAPIACVRTKQQKKKKSASLYVRQWLLLQIWEGTMLLHLFSKRYFLHSYALNDVLQQVLVVQHFCNSFGMFSNPPNLEKNRTELYLAQCRVILNISNQLPLVWNINREFLTRTQIPNTRILTCDIAKTLTESSEWFSPSLSSVRQFWAR